MPVTETSQPSLTKVGITWKNKSNVPVELFWIHVQPGAPSANYSRISPGGSYVRDSYTNHKWFVQVVDTKEVLPISGRCIFHVQVADKDQEFIITNQ